MDSGNGHANYKLEAIKAAIANGTLTKEEIYARLNQAISEEYQKEPQDWDDDFILFCEQILYEMRTGIPYVSRKEECKQALKNRLNKEEQQSTTSSRVITRGLLMAGALMVVLFGVEILFNREWLSGNSTQDEQQYIISGQKIDPNIVGEGQADDSTTEPQSITTTNLDEAIGVLGFTPAMPQWIPDGWELFSYYVAKNQSSKWFIVTYQKPGQEYSLIYQIAYYRDAEQAFSCF